MSVGIPELDADHKKLLALINGTEKAINNADDALLRGVLGDLASYFDAHFKREEAIFTALKVPGWDAHKKQHEAMASKARLIREKVQSCPGAEGRRKLAGVVVTMLNDWLLNHVFKEDMKVKPYVRVKVQRADDGIGLEPATERPAPRDRNRDITYSLPPHLAHLLKRIEYEAEKLPPPRAGFNTFEQFCTAAICRRIDRVITFFHRTNPEVSRPLPPNFLLSPLFAEKFHLAIAKLILPAIHDSRQVRMLATSFDWANADTDSFWDFVPPLLKTNILDTWTASWDDLRLVETKREDGSRVLQVKEPTKLLRDMLAPTEPEDYDLPRVTNREIEIFKSLLDPTTDWWARLNKLWQTIHDLYEQEKEPRVFQQKAREGALRDGLLNAFLNFPDQWGDFVILTCYRVFPRINSHFLHQFSTNLGRNEQEREAHMPYLIRTLRQVREHPNIQAMEREATAEWEAQEQALRKFFKETPPSEQGS